MVNIPKIDSAFFDDSAVRLDRLAATFTKDNQHPD